MSSCIKLRRGYDLPLKGSAPVGVSAHIAPAEVAVSPDDFPGFTPKPAVREGDRVKAGSPLLFDKLHPSVCISSPVAGSVKAIVRGSRRKIERVVVTPDGSAEADSYSVGHSAAEAAQALGASGLWAWMRQLPYGIVPDMEVAPRDIFITAFDSAPLAPPLAASLDSRHLQAGVNLLSRFTKGNIYIGVTPALTLPDLKGAQTVCFAGPHPAGLASVQVNHIAPVNKGDVVWLLDIVTLAKIGKLALSGSPDFSTTVALTGPELALPATVTTAVGADLSSLLRGRVKDDGRHKRVIAGNVLTGFRESDRGFLHFPYRQVTVIAEGDDRVEFMGWASLSPSKMSRSRTFPAAFLPGRKLDADALLHGGRRAMIMSGVYDKMVPMDILTEPLVKAILARDIERMEALGIYEVTPDDFALAEWADPSKLELQSIVRQGLDYMRSEA